MLKVGQSHNNLLLERKKYWQVELSQPLPILNIPTTFHKRNDIIYNSAFLLE